MSACAKVMPSTSLPAPGMNGTTPSTWLDLGSGDGAFTLAIADLLAPRSVIHAIDHDSNALARIPAPASVRIQIHTADFTAMQLTLPPVDGILMANSLHYVQRQRSFLESAVRRLKPGGRFLCVEYDTERGNAWVPSRVSCGALPVLFDGLGTVDFVGLRPSAYRRSPIYAAVVRIA
jgi:ubiquinone/menaquinone biosynthesis C-methylase UbiE